MRLALLVLIFVVLELQYGREAVEKIEFGSFTGFAFLCGVAMAVGQDIRDFLK